MAPKYNYFSPTDLTPFLRIVDLPCGGVSSTIITFKKVLTFFCNWKNKTESSKDIIISKSEKTGKIKVWQDRLQNSVFPKSVLPNLAFMDTVWKNRYCRTRSYQTRSPNFFLFQTRNFLTRVCANLIFYIHDIWSLLCQCLYYISNYKLTIFDLDLKVVKIYWAK